MFIAFLTLNAFSQETKYVVFDNPQDGTCKAFEVKKKSIQTHRYELKELDNPEYITIMNQIDSLENLENNLSSFPDVLYAETKSNLRQAKDFLEQAIDKDKNAELSLLETSILSGKKKHLTNATEFLFKTKFEFEQDVKGRDAIKQAKRNVTKIDDLLNSSLRKEREISSKLHSEITDLKMKIGTYGRGHVGNIPDKINKYVPVEAIEREILLLDTTINVGDELAGSFIAFDNMYGPKYVIMENNYNEYVKNELVPLKDLDLNKWRNFDLNYENIKDYNKGPTYLFKNPNENKLYFTNDDFLSKCGAVEEEQYKALSFLEDKGGKYYNEDDEFWVEINGAKCMFTDTIKKSLANKNISIIQQMEASVLEHKRLKNQASKLANQMVKYMNKYTSALITSEDIKGWKKVTLECGVLLDKMSNLPFNDGPSYHKQIRYEDQTGIPFSDIVDYYLGSKIMLGL